MYHRVKNNFQTVCSVLSLQAQYLEDEKVLTMFSECQDRVRAMALIHERLYRSEDLIHINFEEFLTHLVQGLFWSYSVDPKKIEVKVYVEDLKADMKISIPCGLIINELVSNAFKYAFPEETGGTGKIEVLITNNKYNDIILEVKDNGIGFPADLDFKATNTLGLQLVIIFAEDQLNGKITLDREGGTAFKIVFNSKAEKKIADFL